MGLLPVTLNLTSKECSRNTDTKTVMHVFTAHYRYMNSKIPHQY